MDERERIQVESRAEWRAWLAVNHAREEGVWLVRFKKHCGVKYVSTEDAIDEALCFGWIDSLPRKLDDDRTLLWFTPRKPGSNWSKRNKERVTVLIAGGQMTAAGLAKIEASKQDGTWNALDAVEALEIPPDLAAEFARYGTAQQNFEAFPRSVKRGILEWILNARRPETRAKRIADTARLAEENIRANQ